MAVFFLTRPTSVTWSDYTAGAPPDVLEMSAFIGLLKSGKKKNVTAIWRPIFVQVYSQSIEHFIGVFSVVDIASSVLLTCCGVF